ncbi:family S53 protease [Mycena albidolilacea]|uniref:Family S53 protease n=1 Tax=Mycena albidolilacea TaxID=1033008 RepID=A0AAD6ZCQ2_9AGAR|nr:family S53 protease [Mycena albidolilacea]
MVVMGKRDGPPAGFSRIGAAPADQVLSLHFALVQCDIGGLQHAVYEVSTPGKPRYGRYLTQDEVSFNEFVAPSADTISLVNDWLASNKLIAVPVSPAGDWISVNITVSQANSLLGAEFSTFQNDGTNQTVVRTLTYSIPTVALSPACLQELYGIPSAPAKKVGDQFWVSGFDNGFANKRELQDTPDTQYAIGLTNGIPVTFISTGTLPNDPLTEMLDRANYLLSLKHPPHTVLNTQTPGLEIRLAIHVNERAHRSVCNAYAQLAARGVSYIVQTNLWGAGSALLPGCQPFDASFPATCPLGVYRCQQVLPLWVQPSSILTRQRSASTFSGGGVSNLFKRPRYQGTAVQGYLRATNNTHNTVFNISGRASSAAVFASVTALLNNEKMAAGKLGLGFLDPLIYSNPAAFDDITSAKFALWC